MGDTNRPLAGALETRHLDMTAGETRAVGDGEDRVISGLGSVYGHRVEIPGMWESWDEEVMPGAWSKTIAEANVRSMMNHDTNWLLGTTGAGSLRLEDTDDGLVYEVDINPDDPNAISAHARVARGDIAGSSVWFSVVRETWTEPTEDNGLERPLRQIEEARLYEVGPVVFPAFPQTTSTARSLDGVLRAAGVTKDSRRAEILFDLISDPDSAEERLRDLLARRPELRSQVCDNRAADGAPTEADAPSPAGDDESPDVESRRHPSVAQLRREHALRRHTERG